MLGMRLPLSPWCTLCPLKLALPTLEEKDLSASWSQVQGHLCALCHNQPKDCQWRTHF